MSACVYVSLFLLCFCESVMVKNEVCVSVPCTCKCLLSMEGQRVSASASARIITCAADDVMLYEVLSHGVGHQHM